jgi:acetyl esterase/lipase
MAFNPRNHEISVEDTVYLRHGERQLLARVFRPRGNGPFPAMVEVHGGAWCMMDRLRDAPVNEALARSGVVVAALDFRMPPEAPYPASMADINYGVRWLKSRAEEFGSRPDLVGIMGSSSGGHQAMLTAMKPRDPRYAAIQLATDADAGVRCVVMLWPVIDPLGRYRYAKKLRAAGKPYPEFVEMVLPLHDKYWIGEDAMAEGNPALALERGEQVELPPALYIQGTSDIVHPREHLDKFVANYRKAGGHLELQLMEGEAEGFIMRKPASPAASQAMGRIIRFVHEQAQ